MSKMRKDFDKLRDGDWIVLVHKLKSTGEVAVVHGHPWQFDSDQGVSSADWAGNKLVGFYALPPDCIRAPALWKSVYRGDELPAKNCTCLVCLPSSGGFGVNVTTGSFFDGRFLHGIEPLAFIPLPF